MAGLRHAGFAGEVVVVGREADPPYQRPPLSKRYLLGEMSREQLLLPRPDASLRLGEEVAEVYPDRHEIRLAGGGRLGYSRLLLATGSGPRPLGGHESDRRVLYLREVADADRLRQVLLDGDRLEIVGAGFIGCEVAAAWRTLGVQVTVLEAFEQPLLRVLGPEVGSWLGGVHRSKGVDLRTGARELPEFVGPVLAAVGTAPRTDLAAAAGIACETGVLVDAVGRTDAPDVYAAGDCARFWSPLFEARARVEHYQTAMRHGAAVGRAMAGDERPFAEAPWFWSDQYDLNLQYVGASLPWDQTVVRGHLGEPPFTVFYLQGGRLRAAAGVNDGRTVGQTRRLLEAGVAVAAGELADPAVDLKRLLTDRATG